MRFPTHDNKKLAGYPAIVVPAELPERARNMFGYTGVILSVRRLATKVPWLVRESAAITTPPSNLAATSVVACDPPVDKTRDNQSLTAAEAAPTLKTQRMS